MLGWPRITLPLFLALASLTSLTALAKEKTAPAPAAPAPAPAKLPTGPAKATPPSTAPNPLLPGTPTHTAGIVPKAAPPVESRSLAIVVAGDVKASLTTVDLARVTPLPSPMSTGGKQTLWPLREALALFVRKDARVSAVVLEGGERVVVQEKQWSDPTRVPVLWQNRRGLFKLGWTDAKGITVPKSTELRDVRVLEVILPADPVAPAAP